ncbi:hypothetical protein SAMN05421741_1091, partial [Paenimyroides ummariense]
ISLKALQSEWCTLPVLVVNKFMNFSKNKSKGRIRVQRYVAHRLFCFDICGQIRLKTLVQVSGRIGIIQRFGHSVQQQDLSVFAVNLLLVIGNSTVQILTLSNLCYHLICVFAGVLFQIPVLVQSLSGISPPFLPSAFPV